jgi:hypothetical protein
LDARHQGLRVQDLGNFLEFSPRGWLTVDLNTVSRPQAVAVTQRNAHAFAGQHLIGQWSWHAIRVDVRRPLGKNHVSKQQLRSIIQFPWLRLIIKQSALLRRHRWHFLAALATGSA